ncbi:MAG: EamA family transporter [Candidatus Cloacimonas sp.]|nr:EamA family transporter [Candidatus Cloacimonadota bacterium]
MSFIPTWLVYTLLSLFFYGFWAFFPKVASLYLPVKEVIVYETIGAIIVAASVFISMRGKYEFSWPGLIFSILAGITGLVGTLFFLKALTSSDKTSVIVTMTALYPLITIILAVLFLKETITLKNGIGIAFALIAMYLFAS